MTTMAPAMNAREWKGAPRWLRAAARARSLAPRWFEIVNPYPERYRDDRVLLVVAGNSRRVELFTIADWKKHDRDEW